MIVNQDAILGIIPARYSSTRLEGKPLKTIGNKTMIEHVYKACEKELYNLLVATDDQRIFETVQAFGGNVVLTDPNHETGTNRCLEAFEKWSKITNKQFEYILNIQGDEPLISRNHLTQLIMVSLLLFITLIMLSYNNLYPLLTLQILGCYILITTITTILCLR